MKWFQAMALFAALELGLLVAVQSCGHHVVHREIEELVARHIEHQSRMASVSQGQQTASRAANIRHVRDGDGVVHPQETTGKDDHHGIAHSQEAVSRNPGTMDLQRQTAAPRVEDDPILEHPGRYGGLTFDQRGRSLQQESVPTPAPIRLSVKYQLLGALDNQQQQMLTRVVEAVRRILQKFINVKRPSQGGLLVDPLCNTNNWNCYPDFSQQQTSKRTCGLATIMPDHIVNPKDCSTYTTNEQRQAVGTGKSGPASGAGGGASAYGTGCKSFTKTQGEDVDMYLYITAVHNDDCAMGAAAWAKPCLLDLGNNRPLLGAANVCPGALGLLDEEQLTAVLTHEMIHALGFTDAMYNLTRRPDGTPRPRDELVKSSMVDGKQVKLLATPNVRDAARVQLGCPSLDGAQLEEEGSTGSAGSHWEYTHYQGEVMVASTIFAADGTPPALSNITLSFLDDTGWYVTNRSAAGLLSWSSGAGCQLATSTCTKYMLNVPGQRLFCDANSAAQSNQSLKFMCSKSYKSTGVCRVLNFTGGCGLVMSRNLKETCLGPDAPNDLPAVFGWGMGTTSGRCLPVVNRFQALVGFERFTYPGNGRDGEADAACFDTICSDNGSKVYVKLLGQQFECPEGQYLNLAQLLPSRYTAGRIGPCPSARDLCITQSCGASVCNPIGGECLNGTCYCRLPYTGANCSYNLITGEALPDTSIDDSSFGSADASPPPPIRNWVMVVQLSVAVYNTWSEVNTRQSDFVSAIMNWSSLNSKEVVISNIAGDGAGSAAGESFDPIAAANASGSRRRRRLQQALMPPLPAGSTIVTTLLTPNSSQLTAQLLTKLKDNDERTRLVTALEAFEFYVIKNGITSSTLLTQAMISSPSPSDILKASSTPVTDAKVNRGRVAMIIAVITGAIAFAGIIGAVGTALVLRSRQNPCAGFENIYRPSPMAADDLAGGNGDMNVNNMNLNTLAEEDELDHNGAPGYSMGGPVFGMGGPGEMMGPLTGIPAGGTDGPRFTNGYGPMPNHNGVGKFSQLYSGPVDMRPYY